MKHTLVGYTGFVGGNLAESHTFDRLYNSKNITDAFAEEQDLVVYSGVRAEKFLAGSDPDGDLAMIKTAMENINNMRPKKLILISTIDVYDKQDCDEDAVIDDTNLHPYGKNRLYLEQWVREAYPTSLIVRLPALFGKGLKKNFLFDMLHPAPSMLKEGVLHTLCETNPWLAEYYLPSASGFYKLSAPEESLQEIHAFFAKNSFNALSFTDSRASFQFYSLAHLWADIETALENDLRLLNIVTEPLSVQTIYTQITGKGFENILPREPAFYNNYSKYAHLYGGQNGYLTTKESVLLDIEQFFEKQVNYT